MKEFTDEYKHLEKLCSEIYGQQHGVLLVCAEGCALTTARYWEQRERWQNIYLLDLELLEGLF